MCRLLLIALIPKDTSVSSCEVSQVYLMSQLWYFLSQVVLNTANLPPAWVGFGLGMQQIFVTD